MKRNSFWDVENGDRLFAVWSVDGVQLNAYPLNLRASLVTVENAEKRKIVCGDGNDFSEDEKWTVEKKFFSFCIPVFPIIPYVADVQKTDDPSAGRIVLPKSGNGLPEVRLFLDAVSAFASAAFSSERQAREMRAVVSPPDELLRRLADGERNMERLFCELKSLDDEIAGDSKHRL